MSRRPRLFLVYVDSVFAAGCSRHFRRLGWDVRMAAASEEVCQQVNSLVPTAVILDAELPDRSVSNISTRITKEHPGLPVVLSAGANNGTAIHEAAQVARDRGLNDLAEQVLGAAAV